MVPGGRKDSWRREVLDAVDEVLKHAPGGAGGWHRLGQVTPLPEPGWYALDLREGEGIPSADSFDQLCFADQDGPDRGLVLGVERSQLVDGVWRVQTAGVLPERCRILWAVRLSPQHLWRRLGEGIAALDTAPLADKLAARTLDPLPERAMRDYPPGLLPAQREAYRACVEPGLHAVWGPPGTGKTRVLAQAIADLVGEGKRVLLVSTADVAVDNALSEIRNHLVAEPGTVIRVGAPHLAHDDDVQLSRLAARANAEVEKQLRQIQEEIFERDNAESQLAALEPALADYDHDNYVAAHERIDHERELEDKQAELGAASSVRQQAVQQLALAKLDLRHVHDQLARLDADRQQLKRARDLTAQLTDLDQQLKVDRANVEQLEFALTSVGRGLLKKRRARRELDQARDAVRKAQQHADSQHESLEPIITQCRTAAAPITDDHLAQLDRQLARERGRVSTAENSFAEASRHLHKLEAECTRLEEREGASESDRALVAEAEHDDLPGKYAQRQELLLRTSNGDRDRARLEERLRDMTSRVLRLRRDAEAEIVAQAKVVATTLARARLHSAVARQQFDVVLVDEAGAAVVGEVLLAVGHATRTATLLGDFLQLGPVISREVQSVKKSTVPKWLEPDAFTHCGIRTASDVEDNSGCVALIHQFRFGPNLRRLANDVVYGVLEDGIAEVTGKPPEDTEIVLIDVDGLRELNQVQRSGRYAGWWPVGTLLARALVEHHVGAGEDVGVLAPFRHQVEATHAALRDSGRNLDAAVGTVHSFQGREFDSVIFDMVEDGHGQLGVARSRGGTFERGSVRLFGVGITRARKRLYLIANERAAIRGALGGTPLGSVRRLLSDKGAQRCRAGVLLGLAEPGEFRPVSAVEKELRDVMGGLVEVTDVDDEFSFDDALDVHLAKAQRSVWMWSPWVARKSERFAPLIAAAVGRGVDVRVFVRTDSDANMRRDNYRKWVAGLAETGAKVIRSDVEHRKVVVVDRSVVLLGSQNPLSQNRFREVMITCRGAAFAERMLTEMQAEKHGCPPVCERCGDDFELRRHGDNNGREYHWRCRHCGIDHPIDPAFG